MILGKKGLAEAVESGALVGQEFMKRWVKHANGDRKAVHCFKDALKIGTLEFLKLCKGFSTADRK